MIIGSNTCCNKGTGSVQWEKRMKRGLIKLDNALIAWSNSVFLIISRWHKETGCLTDHQITSLFMSQFGAGNYIADELFSCRWTSALQTC